MSRGPHLEELFESAHECGARHTLVWSEPKSGLMALVVIDDVTLGPAAGGIRTQPYPSTFDALADCARLAHAMTVKCALTGLDAGGGKIVVLEHAEMDRPTAFAALGERLQDLGGLFRAGPDMGTHTEDLTAMSAHTSYVHASKGGTSAAVARGVLRGIEACCEVRGRRDGVRGLRVAVQGCGLVGAAVSRALAAEGAALVMSDIQGKRADALADELGAEVVAPPAIFDADVDVISPCALSGVLSVPRAKSLKAWAVCGGANNVLANMAAADALLERDVLFVPDVLSSAGGVIDGIGDDVMGIDDRAPLIDALRPLAVKVLEGARAHGQNALREARDLARARIDAARRARG